MAIMEDGLLAEAKRLQTDGFLNQRRPRDAHGSHFSAGSAVRFHKDGEDLSGEVVSREFDRVTVSVSKTRKFDLAASDISVYRSKQRMSMKHSLALPPLSPKSLPIKRTFSSFIIANKEEIYRKAADGGVTITEKDGYSADAKLSANMDIPLYQLYSPEGDSLGICSGILGLALDDITSSHLATKLFTEW